MANHESLSPQEILEQIAIRDVWGADAPDHDTRWKQVGELHPEIVPSILMAAHGLREAGQGADAGDAYIVGVAHALAYLATIDAGAQFAQTMQAAFEAVNAEGAPSSATGPSAV